MYEEIGGIPVRVKHIDKEKKELSVEILVEVHPLLLKNQELTSLSSLFHGKDDWIHLGYIQRVAGECILVVYGAYFKSGLNYIVAKKTVKEAVDEMIKVTKNTIDRFNEIPSPFRVQR